MGKTSPWKEMRSQLNTPAIYTTREPTIMISGGNSKLMHPYGRNRVFSPLMQIRCCKGLIPPMAAVLSRHGLELVPLFEVSLIASSSRWTGGGADVGLRMGRRRSRDELRGEVYLDDLRVWSPTSIHTVWPKNVRPCIKWPFANTRVWWQWLRLWRPVSISQSISNQQKSFTCRVSENVAQPTFGSFFFVPIIIMIADKDLTCCSVASRVSSRQIQNLSCKPHPSCIDLRQALPPQSSSSFVVYTRADENVTFDLAWSNLRQSTEFLNENHFGIVIDHDLYWFAMQSLQYQPFWSPVSFLFFRPWYSLSGNVYVWVCF